MKFLFNNKGFTFDYNIKTKITQSALNERAEPYYKNKSSDLTKPNFSVLMVAEKPKIAKTIAWSLSGGKYK